MASHDIHIPSDEQFSFDLDATDQAIRTQGIKLKHYQGLRCPVGLVDLADNRKPHDDHQGCQNGFLYIEAGNITCLFGSNNADVKSLDVGLLDGSSVRVTFPRTYDDHPEKHIYTLPYDRFYLADAGDVLVPNWQLFQAHITGIDRMRYEVAEVEHIIDSSGKEYGHHTFDIVQGTIVWKPGQSPGIDPKTGLGIICAARYRYRPYFFVKSLIHEVRVSQTEDLLGNRHTARLQYAAILVREYMYQNQDADDQSPPTLRQIHGPSSGSFGPR